jgi:hypothetical protein
LGVKLEYGGQSKVTEVGLWGSVGLSNEQLSII